MYNHGLPHTGDGLIMATEIGAATEGLGTLLGAGPAVPRTVVLNYPGSGTGSIRIIRRV